ncbi:MAG: aminopeptidase P family protein [Candidatus Aminicenantes bacterium]|nr:aminopeptidase P family protein [Candidatus Aminicenantes bacterium]
MKDEFKSRKLMLFQSMAEKKLEAVLVYASMLRKENLRYLTNFNPLEPGAAALFTSSNKSVLLTPIDTEETRAKEMAWIDEIVSYDGDVSKAISTLKKLEITGRLGIVGWEYVPTDLIMELRSALPQVEPIDATALVHRLRVIKSESEIQKIAKAAQIADAAFAYLIENMKPGMREYEVIAITEYKIRQSCGEDNFQLLASSQGESRAMHPATNKTINQGDLFLTEISPQFDGYYAQVCRTVVVGEISKERQKAHDIMFKAQQRGIDEVQPGMTASDLAKVQNDVFREEGYAEFVSEKYTRGRGHGIGLYIDEEPLIAEGNDYLLQEGMVVMIHPNTYLPLSGYIVLGDPVLITGNGGKRLNGSERTLISI